MNESKSPLSRWSERKLAARGGDIVDVPAAEAQPDAVQPAAEPPPDAAPIEESEAPALPSIDELDYQSDYTAFLADNVPDALRRAALRKLWTSDPVLANLDGLNDYDEDFNVINQVITLAQSSYRPGHGYLDEAEKKLGQIDETLGETRAAPADSQSEPQESDRTGSDDELKEGDAVAQEPAHATQQSADAELEPMSRILADKSDK